MTATRTAALAFVGSRRRGMRRCRGRQESEPGRRIGDGVQPRRHGEPDHDIAEPCRIDPCHPNGGDDARSVVLARRCAGVDRLPGVRDLRERPRRRDLPRAAGWVDDDADPGQPHRPEGPPRLLARREATRLRQPPIGGRHRPDVHRRRRRIQPEARRRLPAAGLPPGVGAGLVARRPTSSPSAWPAGRSGRMDRRRSASGSSTSRAASS